MTTRRERIRERIKELERIRERIKELERELDSAMRGAMRGKSVSDRRIGEIREELDALYEETKPKKVTIGVMQGDPIEQIKKTLEDSGSKLAEMMAAWDKAKKQSEPVCCFCHMSKKDSHALIQGYAPDKRPIFICSDCILLSLNLLQKRGVKVCPTF